MARFRKAARAVRKTVKKAGRVSSGATATRGTRKMAGSKLGRRAGRAGGM